MISPTIPIFLEHRSYGSVNFSIFSAAPRAASSEQEEKQE
ncbi:hypothetical protein EVA_09338 [gut metagenome]|uniref:Uncharacterized protein n=1 Tax=gut metagenome TaxID=749906 RepID=J9GR54_9ZZZZ